MMRAGNLILGGHIGECGRELLFTADYADYFGCVPIDTTKKSSCAANIGTD